MCFYQFRFWTGTDMIYLDFSNSIDISRLAALCPMQANENGVNYLMQSTGKLDSNNQFIYDQDYVLYNDGFICKVSYSADVLGFTLQYRDKKKNIHTFRASAYDRLKVVGNVYEHAHVVW